MGKRQSARTLMPAVLCATVLLGLSCSSGPRDIVTELVGATVPGGDALPALEGPIRKREALVYSWRFNTHLPSADYLDWVATQLTARGFTLLARPDNGSLRLSHLVGGDAYGMQIHVSTATTTAVEVTVTASPD